MIRWYPRETSAHHIDERLTHLTDGINQVVAYEVYDHPDAKTHKVGRSAGQTLGPWLIGPEDECLAELAKRGFKDYEKKSAAGIGHRETP